MIKSFERIKKQNKERIKVPRTVQDTIPVDTIYKDGIFLVWDTSIPKATVFWISTTRLLPVKTRTICS